METGTRAEIERLYREEGARLWRAVLFLSRDPEIADDAVAEAFAQALARGDAIRSPRPWLWRAAFSIARGQLKERRPQSAARAELAEMPAAGTELLDALSRLSVKQRSAAILHYYAGYTLRETGQLLGSSVPTVSVHLRRARAKLKQYLEADDG